MNNKTITEFDFHMVWRIMQIPEAVIHLKPSSICIIPHIILNLIYQLLNSQFEAVSLLENKSHLAKLSGDSYLPKLTANHTRQFLKTNNRYSTRRLTVKLKEIQITTCNRLSLNIAPMTLKER